MKNLSEQVEWHKEQEARKWKRIVNCIELFLIALAGIVVISIMLIYGNGTKFQSVFVLFLSLLVISTGCFTTVFYQLNLSRWQIKLIKLGFGCGVGISAMTSFLILESQVVNT